MAKQQDPRWQLDLRPVMPGSAASGAASAQGPRIEDVVALLVDLHQSVDGLRDAVDKIGRRLTNVERAVRDLDSAHDSGEGVRPIRGGKPVRAVPRIRPRAVNEGDGSLS